MKKAHNACECGHRNPHGTELCEACGKPLQEDNGQAHGDNLLNMRYEGSARRSQTYNKTVVDKIWNFFSSVKVGVTIIIITLVASALGTIFPQEMYIPPNVSPAEYYQDQYGIAGQLYYQLGFHQLYGSWWYIVLVAALGVSIIIASIDRGVPLYRSLKNQRVTRHPSFLKRQRLFSRTVLKDEQAAHADLKQALRGKHYQMKEENDSLFAEKNRFSRWGAYVNHTGLIIFLIGAMLRFFPGMYVDEVLWLREGETKVIRGTEGKLYLKNESFIFDVYSKETTDKKFGEALERVGGSVAKNYQTNAVLYERMGEIVPGAEPELKEVKSHAIRVNEPLKHDGYAIYQVDFRLDELHEMHFSMKNKKSGESVGELTVNLVDPQSSYELNDGYRVELLSYFPDFFMSETGPDTKTKLPRNPAFIFKMFSPQQPDGEISFAAIGQNIEPEGENQYKMQFVGVETRNVTGLTIRKDHTLWIIGLGGIIFMIGVIQGMYWNHRRLWIQKVGDEVWISAHTNKNWHGLARELEAVFDDTPYTVPQDRLETVKEEPK